MDVGTSLKEPKGRLQSFYLMGVGISLKAPKESLQFFYLICVVWIKRFHFYGD